MAPSAIDYESTLPSPIDSIITPPWSESDSECESSDTVKIGHADSWHYIPSTRLFDLSRGSPAKLIVEAEDGVRSYRGIAIDPEKTVLVVVDMQNYFIHPMFCDHKGGMAAVKPTMNVIERCRQVGVQVAWLNWEIDERDLKTLPPAVLRVHHQNRMREPGHGWGVNLGTEIGNGLGRVLWKGSWNAQLYDPLLAVSSPADLFFVKNRPSGMWSPDQPLHRYLRETEKKTILFAGVNTDQCILGTLTDAYSWGFDCILLGDCAGTMSGFQATELCTYNVATNYGFVSSSEKFCGSALVHV